MTALKEKEQKNEQAFPQAKKVCFVCTGNTCRSPMAEAVTNALALGNLPILARDTVPPSVIAVSAGLYAHDGDPISHNAVSALEQAGIEPIPSRDYHRHTAKNIDERLVEECDLLVAMTPSHAMELLLRFPAAAQRITVMPKAVSDPFGGDLARYAQCLEEITEGVRSLLFLEDET